MYPKGKVITHIILVFFKSRSGYGCFGQPGCPLAVSFAMKVKKPLTEDCCSITVASLASRGENFLCIHESSSSIPLGFGIIGVPYF